MAETTTMRVRGPRPRARGTAATGAAHASDDRADEGERPALRARFMGARPRADRVRPTQARAGASSPDEAESETEDTSDSSLSSSEPPRSSKESARAGAGDRGAPRPQHEATPAALSTIEWPAPAATATTRSSCSTVTSAGRRARVLRRGGERRAPAVRRRGRVLDAGAMRRAPRSLGGAARRRGPRRRAPAASGPGRRRLGRAAVGAAARLARGGAGSAAATAAPRPRAAAATRAARPALEGGARVDAQRRRREQRAGPARLAPIQGRRREAAAAVLGAPAGEGRAPPVDEDRVPRREGGEDLALALLGRVARLEEPEELQRRLVGRRRARREGHAPLGEAVARDVRRPRDLGQRDAVAPPRELGAGAEGRGPRAHGRGAELREARRVGGGGDLGGDARRVLEDLEARGLARRRGLVRDARRAALVVRDARRAAPGAAAGALGRPLVRTPAARRRLRGLLEGAAQVAPAAVVVAVVGHRFWFFRGGFASVLASLARYSLGALSGCSLRRDAQTSASRDYGCVEVQRSVGCA